MNKQNVSLCTKATIKSNKLLCLLICAIVVAIVGVSLVPPQLLRIIIDTKFAVKITEGLALLAVVYLISLFLNYVLEAAKEAVLVIFGQKITKCIRINMSEKANHIKTGYFTSHSSGEISSRFLSDVDKIGELFTSGVAGMVIDCFTIIGITGSIFFFSARLGVMVLVLLPIIGVITQVFRTSILRAQKATRVYIGALSRHISESVQNLRMIKLSGSEKYMEQKYSICLTDNFNAQDKVNFCDSIYSPIVLIIRAVSICVLVLMSAKNVNFFNITLGMVAASIELISSLLVPVERLGMELATIQSAVSGIARVNEFFALEEDAIADEVAKSIPKTGETIIEFKNVGFSYDGKNQILKNINLSVKSGESITFAGRTGAGKTTLFNLVMGLFAPTSGSLKICGCECARLCPKDKHRLVGYVSQSFDYVPGNIFSQISLGDETVSKQEIYDAMVLTGMHEKALALPQGYETIIDTTEYFSQGERQLLSIARAVCCNPPILLLDEITAGLDSLTEEKIMQVLQAVKKSHTILTISHRLTSMLFCDKVVLLEQGEIKSVETAK